MARKPDYEKVMKGRLVRAWRRRGYIEVLVWANETDGTEPVGEWEMPTMLGVELAAQQAEAQTQR